jgi:hypothetical protein
MPAPRTQSDGYVRNWHPDRRVGLPANTGGKTCSHPPQDREFLFNSNGDEIVHCQRCDRSWWNTAD